MRPFLVTNVIGYERTRIKSDKYLKVVKPPRMTSLKSLFVCSRPHYDRSASLKVNKERATSAKPVTAVIKSPFDTFLSLIFSGVAIFSARMVVLFTEKSQGTKSCRMHETTIFGMN